MIKLLLFLSLYLRLSRKRLTRAIGKEHIATVVLNVIAFSSYVNSEIEI